MTQPSLSKMSAKAILEYDGKIILSKYFNKLSRETDPPTERVNADARALQVKLDTDIETASSTAPWINTQVYQCLYVFIIHRKAHKALRFYMQQHIYGSKIQQ